MARWGSLVRRCRRIVDSLEVPDPFDAVELFAAMARQRGRAIDLIPVASRVGLPCGLVVATRQADYILYAADVPDLHRQHILVHEYAHLLLAHVGHGSPGAGLPDGLLTHLSPHLVERVLRRTAYAEPQEREAELVASLILKRVLCHTDEPPAPVEYSDAQARRFALLLGPAIRRGAHG